MVIRGFDEAKRHIEIDADAGFSETGRPHAAPGSDERQRASKPLAQRRRNAVAKLQVAIAGRSGEIRAHAGYQPLPFQNRGHDLRHVAARYYVHAADGQSG